MRTLILDDGEILLDGKVTGYKVDFQKCNFVKLKRLDTNVYYPLLELETLKIFNVSSSIKTQDGKEQFDIEFCKCVYLYKNKL